MPTWRSPATTCCEVSLGVPSSSPSPSMVSIWLYANPSPILPSLTPSSSSSSLSPSPLSAFSPYPPGLLDSFHYTKNTICGEGGALLVNDPKLHSQAVIVREKGTNRTEFMLGKICKYEWLCLGSSYVPSELCAAFLLPQLHDAEEVTRRRRLICAAYTNLLAPLAAQAPPDYPQPHRSQRRWRGWGWRRPNAGKRPPVCGAFSVAGSAASSAGGHGRAEHPVPHALRPPTLVGRRQTLRPHLWVCRPHCGSCGMPPASASVAGDAFWPRPPCC